MHGCQVLIIRIINPWQIAADDSRCCSKVISILTSVEITRSQISDSSHVLASWNKLVVILCIFFKLSWSRNGSGNDIMDWFRYRLTNRNYKKSYSYNAWLTKRPLKKDHDFLSMTALIINHVTGREFILNHDESIEEKKTKEEGVHERTTPRLHIYTSKITSSSLHDLTISEPGDLRLYEKIHELWK